MSIRSRLKFDLLHKAISCSAGLALILLSAPWGRAQLPAVMPIGARVAYSQAAPNLTKKPVRDAAGDVFVMDTTPQIYEIPVSGPEQIVVPSSDPAMIGAQSMTVDPSGNIYVGQTQKIYEIPRNANGTYGTSTSIATALVSSVGGGYYQTADLAVDGASNIYVVITTEGGSTCSATSPPCPGVATINSSIANPAGTGFRFVVGGTYAYVLTHTPTSLALDSAGDLFYADGTAVYEVTASNLAAAATAAPAIGTQIGYYSGGPTCTGCTAISAPAQVYTDKPGNVYVAGNSKVLVIVNNGSAFSTSNATYALPTTISGASQSGVGAAIDNQGNFINPFGASIERYGAGNYYIAPPSNAYAGTIANYSNGSTTTAKDPTFTFLFTASTTLNATTPFAWVNAGSANGGAAFTQITTNTGNTTCAAGATYTAGQTCNISLSYVPREAGAMVGALVLYGTSGNVLTVSTAQGHVTGSAITVDPGVQTVIGTGYVAPQGIAVDGAGNMYVADADSNAVYEYPKGSTSAGTSVGSGLSAPSGVAVDAAGDVFIADTGNNRVVVVPNTLSGLSTASQFAVSTTGYALSLPRGVAIDFYGNLYIADTGNARVLEMANPLAGAVNATPVTVGSGFTAPYAVAIDLLGNVYVADRGANSVILVPGGTGLTTGATNVGSGVQTAVGSGFSAPTGVAVDASGSVYVADSGNASIKIIPSVSGALPTASTTPVVLYSGLDKPFGVATDQTNDVYFTDVSAPSVAFVLRSAATGGTAATLAFGGVATGSTGNVTSVVSNAGFTTSLAFTGIAAPAAPFAGGSGASNACSATSTLTPGSSCNLLLTFTPTATGPFTGTVTFTDNALTATSGATQKVSLTGDASGPVSTVAISGDGSLVYGDNSSYTVTAKDAAGNLAAAANGTYTISTGTGNPTTSVNILGGSGTFLLPVLGVGSYTLSTTVSSIPASMPVTIGKAPLLVEAASVSRIFDQANPALGISYLGFAYADSATSGALSGTLTETTTANRLSSSGSYPISLAGTLTAANYTITENNGTLTVAGQAPQAILFPPLPAYTHGTTVVLTGTSTSGLPLTYTVTAGSATVSGSLLTINAAGTVTVTASQSGNSNYASAAAVPRSFTAQ